MCSQTHEENVELALRVGNRIKQAKINGGEVEISNTLEQKAQL